MATVRQRKRGVWEARVFAGRDGNNKPVQISRTVYGGRRDAERVANELALKPARNAGRRTVEELLGEWRELKQASWAPYTKRDRESRTRSILKDRIGQMPVARLQVSDIDKWIVRLRKAGVGECLILISASCGSGRSTVTATPSGCSWSWLASEETSTNSGAWRTKAAATRLTCWWSWLANGATVTNSAGLPAVAITTPLTCSPSSPRSRRSTK